MVSSIQKSKKKKIKFTMKNFVNFCKGCDVHVFFVEEIEERLCHLKQKILNKDMIVL